MAVFSSLLVPGENAAILPKKYMHTIGEAHVRSSKGIYNGKKKCFLPEYATSYGLGDVH